MKLNRKVIVSLSFYFPIWMRCISVDNRLEKQYNLVWPCWEKGKVARVIALDGLNNGLNSRYTCMVCYTCIIRISLKWDSHLTSFASRWKVYLTFLSTKQNVKQGFSKNTFKIHTPTSNTYMQFVSWKPFRNFARRVTIIWVFTTLFVS